MEGRFVVCGGMVWWWFYSKKVEMEEMEERLDVGV